AAGAPGAAVPIHLAATLRAGADAPPGRRAGGAGAEASVARWDAGAGVRAAGVPGTVGGDDAATGNQLTHLPRGVGPTRPVAGARVREVGAGAHGLDGAAGRRSGRKRSEGHPARLDLGGSHAPGLRHRRAGVSPVWGPAALDRHAARSRRHPEDPRAPRPLLFGTESWPGPSRARRRRILIESALGPAGAGLSSSARGGAA